MHGTLVVVRVVDANQATAALVVLLGYVILCMLFVLSVFLGQEKKRQQQTTTADFSPPVATSRKKMQQDIFDCRGCRYCCSCNMLKYLPLSLYSLVHRSSMLQTNGSTG